MRLTPFQQHAITSVLSKYGQLFLYGSRTQENLKGGDIDLLLITQTENLSKLRSEKYKLLANIESLIGEQKIDLTLATPETVLQDPFLIHISKDMLPMN